MTDDPEHQGQTRSLWRDTAEVPTFAPLGADVEADVCVVGAGIAGLTTAYMLARAGRRVVVLEAGEVGGGNTGRTTAHLASAIDDRYTEVVRVRGRETASLAYRSHTAAIEAIATVVRDEGIDCDFERVDGYLFLAPGHDPELLDDELGAAHEVGFEEVERLADAPSGGIEAGPCLRFPGQAQFHPLKYVAGLARGVVAKGGTIYTRTRAHTIAGGAEPRVVTTGGQTVRAGAIVVATGSPIHGGPGVHTRQAPYMTYALALQVPAGQVPRGLYWDTADPYHYVRVHAGGGEFESLIVGGEDHKAGQADDGARRFAALELWARERFPGAGACTHRWSGMVFESLDGLGLIGKAPGEEGVYFVTGDSGMGLTHGTLAGLLLRDLILGVEGPWTAVYDPGRTPIRAARELLRENLNVAAQYGGWALPGEVRSSAEIRPGSGAIVRRGLHKLAVYRDEAGRLHACSAACPHLHGPVAWNPTESTWDCTCHGSRFDRYGRVIQGPANGDLTATTIAEDERSVA